MAEQNLAVVRRIYDAIANGDVNGMVETHTDPFTLNYPGGSEQVNPRQMGEDLAGIKANMPDLHADVQAMYASGDLNEDENVRAPGRPRLRLGSMPGAAPPAPLPPTATLPPPTSTSLPPTATPGPVVPEGTYAVTFTQAELEQAGVTAHELCENAGVHEITFQTDNDLTWKQTPLEECGTIVASTGTGTWEVSGDQITLT
ncbi:MAG: nuclear transport factor 2 family protein [Gemmatimonadales bacterium]